MIIFTIVIRATNLQLLTSSNTGDALSVDLPVTS